MKRNILITSAGKRVALTKYFKETLQRFCPAAKVFTTDMNPAMAPAGYVSDECFEVPRVTDDDYLEILLSICHKHDIGLVIPTIDTELLILAANRQRFAADGISLSVPDYEFVSICRDKRKTAALFEELNMRVPRLINLGNPSFPMFAKPYDGSLSTDLHIILTPDDLTPAIRNNPRLIFMEYIDKKAYKEFTVDMYFGKDNECKSIVPRERIEIRAGEINKGITRRNYLMAYLRDRMRHLKGVTGCICVQLFYRESDNDVVAIEINPRFGGGYPLSYKAGANYPEMLIREYFMGEKLPYNEDWTADKLMLRFDDAIFI